MLFWLSSISLVAQLFFGIWFLQGIFRLGRLRDVIVPEGNENWPGVSIVVAARNEEKNIQPAIRSLLAMDYPNYELLVVDDRSTDRTASILSSLQLEFPALSVESIDTLPSGWLGKNHAHHMGVEKSQRELVLLTDADIVFAPDTLRRSVYFLEQHQLDHLALGPRVEMPTGLLRGFVITFLVLFFSFTRAWKAKDSQSTASIGVGAFGLFRRKSLMAIEGLKRIRMRPDDDVLLGKTIKANGFRQDILEASDGLCVPWYSSLSEVVIGLEKNSFAVLGYRPERTILVCILLGLQYLWPILALGVTIGWTWWFNLGIVSVYLGLAGMVAIGSQYPVRDTLLFPFCVVLVIFIQLRSMFLAYYRDGIRWRDTHYTLAQLRSNPNHWTYLKQPSIQHEQL